MKLFFYTILASFLYFLVSIGGVKPACCWFVYQPRVPTIK
ncbi:MAG: cyclic lactone autoinducer peptide [Ruminiclostridium sp.]